MGFIPFCDFSKEGMVIFMKKLLNNSLKPSNYNYILHFDENKRIIYNTKTGAIDFVNKQTAPEFDIIMSQQQYKSSNLVLYLTECGYLVPDGVDEALEVLELGKKYSEVKNVLRLVILPAEACNFNCPYCFIYKMRDNYMEKGIYDAIYKKIKKFINGVENGKAALLEIIWFGGEPTLAVNDIIVFMETLNSLLSNQKNKVKLISTIITNGYFLDFNMFKILFENGISHFQITLDGDSESHDKVRCLNNGAPTFQVIYDNLTEILEKSDKNWNFTMQVRANFLKSTIKNCENLFDMFSNDFSEDSRFKIYFRPVSNFETEKSSIYEIASDICELDDGLRVQNMLTFTNPKKVFKEKVTNPLPQPSFTWCNSVQPNSHIIGWDGAVFSCDTMIVDKDKSIGFIDESGEIILNCNAKEWKESIFENQGNDNDLIKECLACKRLPVCMGGCIRVRKESDKNPCFWTDELIYEALSEYAHIYCAERQVT